MGRAILLGYSRRRPTNSASKQSSCVCIDEVSSTDSNTGIYHHPRRKLNSCFAGERTADGYCSHDLLGAYKFLKLSSHFSSVDALLLSVKSTQRVLVTALDLSCSDSSHSTSKVSIFRLVAHRMLFLKSHLACVILYNLRKKRIKIYK